MYVPSIAICGGSNNHLMCPWLRDRQKQELLSLLTWIWSLQAFQVNLFDFINCARSWQGHFNSASQLLWSRNTPSSPPWDMKASHNTGNSVPYSVTNGVWVLLRPAELCAKLFLMKQGILKHNFQKLMLGWFRRTQPVFSGSHVLKAWNLSWRSLKSRLTQMELNYGLSTPIFLQDFVRFFHL